MFGFLKNLLRKEPEALAESQQTVESQSYAEPAIAVEPLPVQAPASRSSSHPAQPRRAAAPQQIKAIDVPLQRVLENLPLELQPRVQQPDVGDLTISVPLEKILAQLARGAVKVYFGDLRQAAPDVFSSQTDRDRVLVTLPLSEILSRLNPALITRRRVQRQIEVPPEISSPFDGTQNQVFSIGPSKPEPAARQAATPARHAAHSAPAAPPRPAAPVTPAAPQAPIAMPAAPSARQNITSVPIPSAPTATPSAAPKAPQNRPAAPAPVARPKPAAAPTPPAAPAKAASKAPPPQPRPNAPALAKSAPPASAKPAPAAPAKPAPPAAPAKPAPAAAPARPAHPRPAVQAPAPAAPSMVASALQSEPAPVPMPSTPAPVAAPTPPAGAAANGAEPLLVSLTALAEGWPEVVRKEIIDLRLVDAKVALPAAAIEQALKQGRIAFSWKTLRFWVKPAVPTVVSEHDSTVLELPLKVVAPVFLLRQHERNKNQQKLTVDEEIPNLFFGFPKPEGTPTPQTARPSDTNFYVWDDGAEMLRGDDSDVRKTPGPATKFVAKYATPNEVVSRAASMDGVTGALIALPDGLMVANKLPPEVNADTLAAFLPQIFGKVSSCTKELRMGELNNLNFTVGNVPWKIFRVHSIFFAAFGKVGEPLPTAQLAALASELDHKPK